MTSKKVFKRLYSSFKTFIIFFIICFRSKKVIDFEQFNFIKKLV